MLTEEFYPPLGTFSVPGNLGALLVPSKDIEAWLDHQQAQRGERLMFVADVLRDLSSSRIERAIQYSGNRLERALLGLGESTKNEDTNDNDIMNS